MRKIGVHDWVLAQTNPPQFMQYLYKKRYPWTIHFVVQNCLCNLICYKMQGTMQQHSTKNWPMDIWRTTTSRSPNLSVWKKYNIGFGATSKWIAWGSHPTKTPINIPLQNVLPDVWGCTSQHTKESDGHPKCSFLQTAPFFCFGRGR